MIAECVRPRVRPAKAVQDCADVGEDPAQDEQATTIGPPPSSRLPAKQIATQPSKRYSGTPTHRGADGHHIVSVTPATPPVHTMDSTSAPVRGGIAKTANRAS